MRDVTFKFSSLCCLRMLSVNMLQIFVVLNRKPMLQIFVVLNRKPIVHRFQCLDLYVEIASFTDRLWWLSCGLQFLKLWTKLLFLITDWLALVHLTLFDIYITGTPLHVVWKDWVLKCSSSISVWCFSLVWSQKKVDRNFCRTKLCNVFNFVTAVFILPLG